MIRTISDLLRHFGDRTLLAIGGTGNGRRSVITFEIDHPAECLRCSGTGKVLWRGLTASMRVTCEDCHGSGLALDLGGEG